MQTDPVHVCCSCEQLHKRRNVSQVTFSVTELGTAVWPRLKAFILERDETASKQVLFMCNYCKQSIKIDKMPPRCVLNGLETVEIKAPLAKLDRLSRQLIQRAKCYQTVVRLGTYTHKVPAYNSLKACKGTMFFLPLPFNNTVETVDEVIASKVLPEPELYIIINGKPTKNNVLWRDLVDVEDLKAAIEVLKKDNWLYKDLDDSSVDEAAKKVLEVANNTTSKMLDKATKQDIDSFQAFTIRDLDSKLSSEPDIEQYKLLGVKEDPLDSRQQHLDVMCFPVLFPNGKFGKYDKREKEISHSEYIKSRLLNKDSRFRKDPQYVFYLLWQKELRELAAGVYNVLQSNVGNPRSVHELLHNVNVSDERLEANLCTMLQSVRGTSQYWYRRKGELRCMLRELGPPSLFLTLSCAEYASADIEEYLRKVNYLPPSYNIGKLCTEDPISVSIKFSAMFHAFFKIFIKGGALGKVDHYYIKKEYQARGAPHYHFLLWIHGAPVAGVDPPEKVLAWIEKRITCQIPDKDKEPELYDLVTRYQMHKCSAYWKKPKKCGTVFVKKCKFGFLVLFGTQAVSTAWKIA